MRRIVISLFLSPVGVLVVFWAAERLSRPSFVSTFWSEYFRYIVTTSYVLCGAIIFPCVFAFSKFRQPSLRQMVILSIALGLGISAIAAPWWEWAFHPSRWNEISPDQFRGNVFLVLAFILAPGSALLPFIISGYGRMIV